MAVAGRGICGTLFLIRSMTNLTIVELLYVYSNVEKPKVPTCKLQHCVPNTLTRRLRYCLINNFEQTRVSDVGSYRKNLCDFYIETNLYDFLIFYSNK